MFKKLINHAAVVNNLRKYVNKSKTFSSSAGVLELKTNVKDQTINYVKTGEGKKIILCFPGALGTIWSDFKPQILGLDKTKFTVIAWDPPGYGYSRPPERNFCQEFYHNDAATAYEFMTQLGFNEFSLLGWSDGGISSMILSAKYPNAVDKLVIWGANAYVLPEEIQYYEKIRNISQWSEKMKAPLIALYGEQGLQKMWNDWCDALQEMHRKNKGDICKNSLENINCPTLILHGDKDPIVAPEHPDYLMNNIEKARLYRFPDGKHNIHLRYSDEFNKIVTDFLL